LRSLRSRLFLATLAALGLTLALTISVDAVLTRRQVDKSQAEILSLRADDLARAGRESVSYVNVDKLLGQVRELVQPRPKLSAYVPDVSQSSNGRTTYQGEGYLYSYRTLPSRGLLLLRPTALGSALWAPFLRDLLLSGAVGVALAALLSAWLARSIVRPIRRVAAASNSLASEQVFAPLPIEGSAELVSLATAFNEMAAQLARSRETERNFLLSVSHELKTPLTAIRGYAEGLSEGAFAPEDAARTILVESRRLERLVRDLLDLARMNRSEFAVGREPVDLAEVAREAVGRHEAAAREFGVELATEPEETWVDADADRLLQIASNLIENALRETPRGGSVVVRTGRRRLSVSDTGPGLVPDDLSRAFDRFFLYDKYGRERPVGSGLGLAIVKQLALAMGGSVTVESTPGAGATFVLTLPSGTKPRGVDHLEVGARQTA
jgi:two-component system sensor histidine kinase BaeS